MRVRLSSSDVVAGLSPAGLLLLTRLKPPAQQLLARAAIPGLPVDILRDLSVDHAVSLAATLYRPSER